MALSLAVDTMTCASVLVILFLAVCAGAEEYKYHINYLEMPVSPPVSIVILSRTSLLNTRPPLTERVTCLYVPFK